MSSKRRNRDRKLQRHHAAVCKVLDHYRLRIDKMFGAERKELRETIFKWRHGWIKTRWKGHLTQMQRQFTIELRVDYADEGKNDAMKQAIASAARHVYATAQLLADQTKPEIAIFSDDFFQGNQQIALLEDVIAKGQDQLAVAGDTSEGDTGISDELLGALKPTT